MFIQIRFCKFMLVMLCAGFISGVIGCGTDDDNPWVGTWSLETFEGKNVQEQVAAAKLLLTLFGVVDVSYSDNWTFDDDQTWERDITIVAGETVSFEVTGTYALSDSDYTITPKSSTIPTEESEVDLGADLDPLESTFGNTEMDSGTWSLDGDTLTLTSKTGKVYGFKKK